MWSYVLFGVTFAGINVWVHYLIKNAVKAGVKDAISEALCEVNPDQIARIVEQIAESRSDLRVDSLIK